MKPYFLILLPFVAGCAQMTPSHNIPVRQDYIEAGLQPGDAVEIVLKDGAEKSFEVVDVQFNQIGSPDGPIEIGDIESITKRSWTEPGHPCGGNEPLGCSIPEVVLVLSDEYRSQTGKFHPACVRHDFCYRHGYLTYDETRDACDTQFLADMKEACGGLKGLNLLDLEQYSYCNVAADQTYNAVRLKGEPHFKTTNGSYCDYKFGDP